MKTTYYKSQSKCLFFSFSPKNKIKITIDLYDFNAGIAIKNYELGKLYLVDDMIECTKLEFDKAFNLALALISNKTLNTKQS